MRKGFVNNEFNFWRYLINFWSIVFFIAIIWDFYTNNSLLGIMNLLATVYVSALAIYVSNKEFERWYDKHYSRHPGEIFVVIWSLLVFALFVLDFMFDGGYQIPNSVISSYIAVLTILAVTRKSKEIYQTTRLSKKRK